MEKKEEKTKERRIKERLAGYHLVKYRPFDQVKEEPYLLSSVINISASGALLKSFIPIVLGTVLDLKINFPMLDDPVRTLAKVVRINVVKTKPRYYEVGVQFIDIDEEKSKIMDQAISLVNKKLQVEKDMAVKNKGGSLK